MISYEAAQGCEDLTVYTDPKTYMAKLYLENKKGFSDLEIKTELLNKGFTVSRSGVCLLRSQINKDGAKVININGEKRKGLAVWRWREK